LKLFSVGIVTALYSCEFLAYLQGIETGIDDDEVPAEVGFLAYLQGIETILVAVAK